MSLIEEKHTHCPYCGEPITLVIDCSLTEQQYIEDCQVCCRPMTVSVTVGSEGEPDISLFQENDC